MTFVPNGDSPCEDVCQRDDEARLVAVLDEQLDKPVVRAKRLVHPKAQPDAAADDRGGPDPRRRRRRRGRGPWRDQVTGATTDRRTPTIASTPPPTSVGQGVAGPGRPSRRPTGRGPCRRLPPRAGTPPGVVRPPTRRGPARRRVRAAMRRAPATTTSDSAHRLRQRGRAGLGRSSRARLATRATVSSAGSAVGDFGRARATADHHGQRHPVTMRTSNGHVASALPARSVGRRSTLSCDASGCHVRPPLAGRAWERLRARGHARPGNRLPPWPSASSTKGSASGGTR